MAKLKAPLLSLGASGAIGKSVVFFPWKGIDAAREYVVPANPKTARQTTQRGYMKDAVACIHYCEGLAADPLAINDTTSYALLGSLELTPRTWFNTIVRQWLKQKVASKIPAVYRGGSCTPGSLKLTLKLLIAAESSAITNGTINYGKSKSALIYSIACTVAELNAGKDITGLTSTEDWYCQFKATLPVTFVGTNSGIWHGKPTA